jgi:hypothetical protein
LRGIYLLTNISFPDKTWQIVRDAGSGGKATMIAKDLMPWLFVNRKAQWTPFAKVRCEGGRCVWSERPKARKSRRALVRAA